MKWSAERRSEPGASKFGTTFLGLNEITTSNAKFKKHLKDDSMTKRF